MRRQALTSLRVRLPLLAMAILAVSLGLTTVLAYQLLANVGQRDLDLALVREQRRFEQSLAAAVSATQGAAEPAAPKTLVRLAAADYQRLQPPGEEHVTIVRVGDDVVAPPIGPERLVALFTAGGLPATSPGRLTTLQTSVGQVRSLVAPISAGGRQVGTLQVASALQPLSAATSESLRRMTLMAVVSLGLGGLLLALALYRGLAPLRDLAATARSTEAGDLSSRVPEPERLDEVGVLAREFNHMLERLERAAQDQREFMASVSHELRTPITIARGHIETLERVSAGDPKAVAETSAVVRDELQRISRLVEDLMALARSEMDGFVVPASMQLDQFFEDLELRLTGLGMPHVRLVRPDPDRLVADADRLAQALLNLIVNAAVHTPEGTPIEVRAERSGDWIVFTVRDEGTGIDPAIRDRIFQPFVKARTQGVHRSTGLGLAVVAAVVDAHGGSISVDTGPQGTTIRLSIPARTPDPTTSLALSAASLGWQAPDPANVPVRPDDDTTEVIVVPRRGSLRPR